MMKPPLMKDMIRQIQMLVFCIFCFLSLNLHAQRTPAWVKDPSVIANEQACMYARATGDSELEARNQALEILSGNISSSVSAVYRAEKEVTEGKTDGKSLHGQIVETSSSTIDVSTQNRLFNVRLEYYTANDGTVHALAWFPVEETKNVCLTLINDNNSVIKDIMSANPPPLELFTGCLKAEILADENDQLFGLLKVLDPELSRVTEVIRAHEILALCETIAGWVTFSIETTDSDQQLATQLAGLISAMRWVVVEKGSLYTLKGEIKFSETNMLEGVETVRWTINLKVTEGEKELGSYSKKGIQDHQTVELAKEAVYGKLVKLLLTDKMAMKNLFGIEIE